MARIISGKQGAITGRPGFGQLPKGNFVKQGVRRLMRRDPAAGVTTLENTPAYYQNDTRASLTQVMAGANNDMKFTSKLFGTDGNSIRVRFVNPGGTASRTISVSGLDITVNLAVTAGAINSTETAVSIRDALNADAAAKALITAETAEGTGLGVVAAFAFTALTGASTPVMAQRRPPALQEALHPGGVGGDMGKRRFVPGGIQKIRVRTRNVNRGLKRR